MSFQKRLETLYVLFGALKSPVTQTMSLADFFRLAEPMVRTSKNADILQHIKDVTQKQKQGSTQIDLIDFIVLSEPPTSIQYDITPVTDEEAASLCFEELIQNNRDSTLSSRSSLSTAAVVQINREEVLQALQQSNLSNEAKNVLMRRLENSTGEKMRKAQFLRLFK